VGYRKARAPHVLVAAYNAPLKIRAMADYLCSGADDQVQINAAIVEANAAGGGIVELSEGTFNVNPASGQTSQSGTAATIATADTITLALLGETGIGAKLAPGDAVYIYDGSEGGDSLQDNNADTIYTVLGDDEDTGNERGADVALISFNNQNTYSSVKWRLCHYCVKLLPKVRLIGQSGVATQILLAAQSPTEDPIVVVHYGGVNQNNRGWAGVERAAIAGNASAQPTGLRTYGLFLNWFNYDSRLHELYVRYLYATQSDTFVDGNVTVETDTIESGAHGFSTGDAVTLTTTGTLPTGLSLATTYYVVRVDADSFKLAATLAHALAGTPVVDITAAAGGGTHTITGTTTGDGIVIDMGWGLMGGDFVIEDCYDGLVLNSGSVILDSMKLTGNAGRSLVLRGAKGCVLANLYPIGGATGGIAIFGGKRNMIENVYFDQSGVNVGDCLIFDHREDDSPARNKVAGCYFDLCVNSGKAVNFVHHTAILNEIEGIVYDGASSQVVVTRTNLTETYGWIDLKGDLVKPNADCTDLILGKNTSGGSLTIANAVGRKASGGTDAYELAYVATKGDVFLGGLTETAADGVEVHVITRGRTKVRADGSGTAIAVGDWLTADTDGEWVKAASGDWVKGFSREASTSANDVIEADVVEGFELP